MADYSNQLKLKELNAHRVSNDIPAITAEKLIELESYGWRSNVGLPDEDLDGLTKNYNSVIDRERISVSQTIKANQANVEALFNVSGTDNLKNAEVPYTQDREFGTYENNLTGQTVNAEAEKIFARQNKIRDAVNEELVSNHNKSLESTYSSGDKGLAKQLESRTYGVDVDRNQITPGNETSFIDETSDRYGQSEQNVSDAAAAVAATVAAENARQNDRIENIAKASDDQAYVDNSRRLAAELQKKDEINESAFEREQEIKKRVNKIKKEEKAKADSAARLKKINDKTAEIAATAAAQKAKRDEKAVEKEIAEFEDDLKKSLKYDEQARQITEEQRATDLENANRLAFQDGLMLEQDKVVDGIVTGGNTTGSASDSSQSQYEIANQRAVAVAKEAEQDAINDTTAKDMTTTVRELAAERAEKERQKQIQNSIDNEQSTNAENKTRLSAEQREKDIKQRTSALQREKDVDERAAKLVAEEKAKKEKRLHEQQINNADANADFSKTDTSPDLSARRGTGGLNRGELRKKMAENKANQIAEAQNTSENNFQADDNFSTQQGLLAGDPYAFSTLSYPSDVTNNNENGHYVLFYVNVQNKTKYEYLGLEGGNYVSVGGMIERKSEEGKDFNPKSVFTKRKGYESVADVSYQEQQIANGAKGSKFYNNMTTLQRSRKAPLSGINSRYPTTTRITDSVALYLPPGIGNSLSANYGDFATGVAGYLALSGLDVVSKLQQNDFVGAATDLFGVGGTLLTEAVKKLAVGALETFTGSEGIQQTFDKAFGQTLNPYMEVAYNSMGMRTFDYTFKFAPKSRKESDEAKAIIQLFRFHMAPEMIDDAHRYLTLPSTFDIHYMYQSGSGDAAIAKENSFYNKIATCVLTGVDVNYTPNDGVKSFADGAPTEIALTLNFKETEMLTKQKINDGF